jgi:hypothetical protein
MIRATHLAFVVFLAALSACGVVRSTPVSSTPTDRPFPQPAARPGTSTVQAARETKKRVTAKEEPATLVATDRTQCVVDVDDFMRIRVGDEAACLWSPVARP